VVKNVRGIPMVSRAVLIVGLVSLALAITGCEGSEIEERSVSMVEFKFEPRELTVQRGQKVVVTLHNVGTAAHNFTISDLNVRSADIQPGKTAKVEFTPDRAGTFRYMCTVPGHEEAGMIGTLTVR